MRSHQTFKITGALERAVDEVDRALASGACDLVLDFRHTTFISVEGLEWLEELLIRSASVDVKIGFSAVPPSLYKVFKVANVDSLLEACGALAVAGPAC